MSPEKIVLFITIFILSAVLLISCGKSYTGASSGTTTTTTTTTSTTVSNPPQITSLTIASGAASTESRTIAVQIVAQDDYGISAYLITEESSTPTSGWQTYSSSTEITTIETTYTLSSGGGTTKEVYVWVKDTGNNTSNESGSIYLTTVGFAWVVTREVSGTSIEARKIATGSAFVGYRSYDQGGGTYNSGLLKYNSNGTLEWSQAASLGESNEFKDMAVLSSGNLLALAPINGAISTSSHNPQYFLEFNKTTGAISTLFTYDSASTENNVKDSLAAMALDNSDNIYAIGSTVGKYTAGLTCLRFDNSGNLVWRVTTETESLTIRGIVFDNSSSAIYGSAGTADPSQELFFKLAGGTFSWSIEVNSEISGSVYIKTVTLDNSSNIIISYLDLNLSQLQAITNISKYNPSGTRISTKQLSFSTDHFAAMGTIALDSNNNIYIAGVYGSSINNLNPCVLKMDSNYNTLWTKTIPLGDEYFYYPISIAVNESTGEIYIAITRNASLADTSSPDASLTAKITEN